MEIDKVACRSRKFNIALESNIPISRINKFLEGYDNLNYCELNRLYCAINGKEYIEEENEDIFGEQKPPEPEPKKKNKRKPTNKKREEPVKVEKTYKGVGKIFREFTHLMSKLSF